MRVLLDYRAALRARSGVGEYTHQMACALLAAFAQPALASRPRALDLALFSSSWKDRLRLPPDLALAEPIDRRVPVRLLNLAWHRIGWPGAERLTGRRFDVTHSMHPLLLPARDAAQIVTVHDLDFLAHPERTRGEIRRDYPALAAAHARRADAVIVVSPYTAREVVRRLGVPADRVAICPGAAPAWPPRARPPAGGGYILFFGTLEPRKNVGGLLDAYEALTARRADAPELVLAGSVSPEGQHLVDRIGRAGLRGRVRHLGYVEPSARYRLYEQAAVLVQPSFEEGFGLTVLEAMTVGVPVVAADRGALPELLDGAGALVEPDDPEGMARAIERILDDETAAAAAVARGAARAARFSWDRTARLVYDTYERAMRRRCGSA
ncbi:MAG: glycosyltransferase family 4 protein [Acidobacteria bacterium]|nr:glycosyltransferase family 4 protein [Acidobacteriota bacterium]